MSKKRKKRKQLLKLNDKKNKILIKNLSKSNKISITKGKSINKLNGSLSIKIAKFKSNNKLKTIKQPSINKIISQENKVKDEQLRASIKQHIKLSILPIQRKLLKLTNKAAEYDEKLSLLDKWAIQFNPEYKFFESPKMSAKYTSLINDLAVLRNKFKQDRISKEEYIKQLEIKKRMTLSYEKELENLKGEDNFLSANSNFLVNTIFNLIWEKYFEEFHNVFWRMDRATQEKVLHWLFENDKFINTTYSNNKDLFMEHMLSRRDIKFEKYQGKVAGERL